MKLKDKNGKEITWRDEVEVDDPKPDGTDLHSFSFIGKIADIIDTKGTVIVEDQDSDFFEIEAERVALI